MRRLGSRGSWAIGSQPAIPRAVGQGPRCESPTRPVPPTADTPMMPEAASGAREHRARVALAPTLRTSSLVTFCSTRLLSQQPPRGPPGMGGCAESLSRAILPFPGDFAIRSAPGEVWAGGLGWAVAAAASRAPSGTLGCMAAGTRARVHTPSQCPESLPLPHSRPPGSPKHRPLLMRALGLVGLLVPGSSPVGTPGGCC